MYHGMFLIGLLFIFVTFWIFVLSLLKFFPILLSAPLLLASIIFTLHCFNEKRRFRGFS